MSRTFQAIIWDFGGVFTSSPFEAFNRYEVEKGLPVDFIRTVNSLNPLENAWAKLERSEVDAETFDQLFRAEAMAPAMMCRGAISLASCRAACARAS